jgi:hypothetical protein
VKDWTGSLAAEQASAIASDCAAGIRFIGDYTKLPARLTVQRNGSAYRKKAMEIVCTKDSGTLQYEIFFNEDERGGGVRTLP